MKFKNVNKFYINGQWILPSGQRKFDVINPANEELTTTITLGEKQDVDAAVAAAVEAFKTYSKTSVEERIELLKKIQQVYEKRFDDVVDALIQEMGLPISVAKDAQAVLPLEHIKIAIKSLQDFQFEEKRGITLVRREPVGVCALITPWNWPPTSISVKVLPAIATGCTMVLKPSEYSPLTASIWAEIMDEAGVPAGVFNMVVGDGPVVGNTLTQHPDINMISFTGSTRAGIQVAQSAAPGVKRVHQELGGKSPNILLDDADFSKKVPDGMKGLMFNSGQNCSAPSRMLVPQEKMQEVIELVKKAKEEVAAGTPEQNKFIGPVINKIQYENIQKLIQKGIDEGAELVIGGTGKPSGLEQGYYVQPTVFANVTNEMTIARQEIFGPVLVIIGYEDIDDAIRIANDTQYGLAGYVQGTDFARVIEVSKRILAGQIYLNGSGTDVLDLGAPFGGYKKSGNGREWGSLAFDSYLEIKALVGYETEKK